MCARAAGRQRATASGPPRVERASCYFFDLAGVLDRLEGRELDVVELAVLLLDLADVDVLHDVARLGIDRDRPARALPGHALHGRDQRVAVGLAAGLLEGLVDQVHAVVAADRHEVRPEVVGLLEGLDVGLVLRRGVVGRVDVRGHRAEHGVAHAVQQVVVGHVAGADQLDAGLVEAALGVLLHEGAALAGGHEHEDGIRLGVGGALQERREIRVGERHLDRLRRPRRRPALKRSVNDFSASAPGA